MADLNASIRDIRRPPGVDQLPIDDRGWPVPWFVDWPNGVPDHRLVDSRKFTRAIRTHACWLCGGPLGRVKASVIGPMCAITRTTSEPPCHPQCARYAVLTCPFLSKPRARRNEKNLPEERRGPAGAPNDRNPGVSVVWESLYDSKPFNPMHGCQGTLFTVGAPHRVSWWCEGRRASREEALAPMRSGLPFLRQEAATEGEAAVVELAKMYFAALALLPA